MNFSHVMFKNVSVMTGLRRVDPLAVRFIRQRQNQTGNGQRTTTGISEAEQRHKQYQAGVEVTSTGSEFQGRQSGVKHRVTEYRETAQKC